MSCTIQDAVPASLARVRDDRDPADWVLAGFEGKESIKLLGCGTGGIAALAAAVPDGDVAYGIVKKTFTFETVRVIRRLV